MSAPKPQPHAPAAPSDAQLERTTLAKVSRRLIPFMFLLYIANFIDRVNVSFAALGMNEDLGLSGEAYGFGAGIFFLGYLAFQVPANMVLVRVGARRWIGAIVIAWSIVAGAMALVRTPTEFYVLRVLLGIAEAGFFPGMIMYLTLWFPTAERARSVARFMTAVPLSAVVGGPLAGMLLSLGGVAGVPGWRWLFFLEALPSLVLGCIALGYLTDRPSDATWLGHAERDWLEAEIARDCALAAKRFDVSPARTLSNGTVWALAVLWLLLVLPYYGMTLWLPQLLREHADVSNLQLGMLAALPPLAGSISMVAVGSHSDRTRERFAHLAVPQAVAVVGLLIAALSHSLPQTLVGLALAYAGANGICGPFWSLPSRFLGGGAAASAIGLINMIGSFGGFAAPYALGALKDRTQSFTVALLALAALPAVAAALVLLLRRAPLLAGHDT